VTATFLASEGRDFGPQAYAWRKALFLIACWAGGLLLAHYPTILSGFARMQNDLGDSRFVNYLLEHSYRWLLREPRHASLWSPPFFYPARNTAAYSEIMIGAGPFYWPWRLVGFRLETAFQLWMITVSSINFWAAYFWLRRGLALRVSSSTLGAMLFAFGAPRLSQMSHLQLLVHCYTILALHAAMRVLGGPGVGNTARDIWIVVFFASVAAQFLAGMYLGWFLSIGLFWGLLLPGSRRTLLGALRGHGASFVVAAIFAALILAPLAINYHRAAQEVGFRDPAEVLSMVPTWRSWLNLAPQSWLYGSLRQWFQSIPMEHEQRNGLGFATTAVCALGLVWERDRPVARFMLLTAGTALLLSTSFEGLTAWRLILRWFPAVGAFRAVSRISIALLVPAAVGLALFCDRLLTRRAVWPAVILGLVCVLEQGQVMPAFSKRRNRADVAAVTHRIDPRCNAFLFTQLRGHREWWEYALDAMWASLETGVPTLNGYSGNAPSGWALAKINIRTQEDDERVAQALAAWTKAQHLDAGTYVG